MTKTKSSFRLKNLRLGNPENLEKVVSLLFIQWKGFHFET